LAAYPIQDYAGNSGARLSAMVTDASFVGPDGRTVRIGECDTLHAAQNMATAGAPVWMYRMERLGSQDFMQHGYEVSFVFGAKGLGSRTEDRAASKLLGEYWTNFATFHNPNGAKLTGPAASHWPALNTSAPLVAHMHGSAPVVAPPLRTKWCEFWQNLLGTESKVKTSG